MIAVANLLSAVGLAARAREVVSGEDFCFRAIRQGRARVVLLASDAGANGAKKVRDKCAFYHVPLVVTLNRDDLGRAIGKPSRTVVAITSAAFADMVLQAIDGHPDGGHPRTLEVTVFDKTPRV
ncbi:MAG: ribosomal L7Ae/L30e/S12e/Gadd45 family protein [Firmicutes bacterium]|nr:ribosomal L7Ae/L30e/S12e/Gadd45 family protein [Bacillota bacterium]